MSPKEKLLLETIGDIFIKILTPPVHNVLDYAENFIETKYLGVNLNIYHKTI